MLPTPRLLLSRDGFIGTGLGAPPAAAPEVPHVLAPSGKTYRHMPNRRKKIAMPKGSEKCLPCAQPPLQGQQLANQAFQSPSRPPSRHVRRGGRSRSAMSFPRQVPMPSISCLASARKTSQTQPEPTRSRSTAGRAWLICRDRLARRPTWRLPALSLGVEREAIPEWWM